MAPDPSAASRFMGLHIVVELGDRDPGDLFDALEEVLCDLPADGDDCRVELMASCTSDLETVMEWVSPSD